VGAVDGFDLGDMEDGVEGGVHEDVWVVGEQIGEAQFKDGRAGDPKVFIGDRFIELAKLLEVVRKSLHRKTSVFHGKKSGRRGAEERKCLCWCGQGEKLERKKTTSTPLPAQLEGATSSSSPSQGSRRAPFPSSMVPARCTDEERQYLRHCSRAVSKDLT
jgi:hypothetical protein